MAVSLNLASYGVEFIGTFLFLSVIIITGNPIAIAIALLAMIYFSGNISGGHLNPAVSVMSYMNGGIDLTNMMLYISSQVLGALAAYYFYTKVYLVYKKN